MKLPKITEKTIKEQIRAVEKAKKLKIYITEKTIKEHIKAVEKAKKLKIYKAKSDEVYLRMLKENPELTEIILPMLESKKIRKYKQGYLAGATTIYDILRRQAKKSK